MQSHAQVPAMDLPVVRRTMTGSDDDTPTARGPHLRARAWRPEGRESSCVWCPADFPALSIFTGCTVSSIFTGCTASAVTSSAVTDLAIYDAKEESWMAVHENERDLLEDTVYRRLVSLWSEFSDDYTVFDKHGSQRPCPYFVRSTGMGSPSRGFPSQAQAHAHCPSCSRDWTPYDM
jgi:hypothetical protein